MSSREIAELLEKQHSHIKVSAERLAEKSVIGTLAVREFTHEGTIREAAPAAAPQAQALHLVGGA
jgi:phage regulator Rha-like protein